MSGPDDPKSRVTELLSRGAADDREALDQIVPLVYDELRQMARRQLAGHKRYTLDTTALVDEAYLRMVDRDSIPLGSRAYFFGAAARAMRQVLVDAARRRNRDKRGAGQPATELQEEWVAADGLAAEVLELNEGLERLAEHYPRQASVVECRFFGGLSVEETAQALNLSERTVVRDWTLARAWLYRALNPDALDHSE
ncbi:MAG: ECF-type sigma factor [Wenzhouxiangella sp.]|jgi:RNA polymerase sigma factor (TIGR02999 family)|nr:ECF-type sigma factor [Wenzhouxiangella sp.]